ncbi:MAG TPA: hypothetical protein VF533_19050 [Solirubrobacteraceae bacterium]
MDQVIAIRLDPAGYGGERERPGEEFAARGFRQVSIARDGAVEIHRGVADSSVLPILATVPGVLGVDTRGPASDFPLSERDWRISGRADALRGLRWQRRSYRQPSEEWDHEHCQLCWATFLDVTEVPDEIARRPEVHVEGYATLDDRWLCPPCFATFREHFGWEIEP